MAYAVPYAGHHALPPPVAQHPVLDRLTPDLREKVMHELQQIQHRKGRGGGAAGAAAARYHMQGAHQPQRLHHPVTPPPPPPENHAHATAQTNFPSDASIQTDPPGSPINGLPAGMASATGTSMLPGELAQPYHSSPTGTAGLHDYIASHPLVRTTPDGEQQSPTHPEEGALHDDAHTRFVMDRLSERERRRHGRRRSLLDAESNNAARLGFPSGDGDGSFDPKTHYTTDGYEVSFGGPVVQADELHSPHSPQGSAGELRKRVEREFWREFNLEFDRKVTTYADPELDSLLEGVAGYGAPAGYAGYGGEGVGGAVGGGDGVGVGVGESPRYSSASAARLEAQDVFWDEYQRNLDQLMQPAPRHGSQGAGRGRRGNASVGNPASAVSSLMSRSEL